MGRMGRLRRIRSLANLVKYTMKVITIVNVFYRFFEVGMDASAQARRLLEIELRAAVARKEFGKRKVGAEQQQEVGLMNGVVGSAIPEQAGHADRVWIVML